MKVKFDLTRVYVAQPYGGNKKAKKLCKKLMRVTEPISSYVLVSPVLALGCLYDSVERYERGIDLCLGLLQGCDKLLLLPGWRESRGCMAEYAAARLLGMPIIECPVDDTNTIMVEELVSRLAFEGDKCTYTKGDE